MYIRNIVFAIVNRRDWFTVPWSFLDKFSEHCPLTTALLLSHNISQLLLLGQSKLQVEIPIQIWSKHTTGNCLQVNLSNSTNSSGESWGTTTGFIKMQRWRKASVAHN